MAASNLMYSALMFLQEQAPKETDTSSVRIVAGVLLVVIVAILILRRKSKAAKKTDDEF